MEGVVTGLQVGVEAEEVEGAAEEDLAPETLQGGKRISNKEDRAEENPLQAKMIEGPAKST